MKTSTNLLFQPVTHYPQIKMHTMSVSLTKTCVAFDDTPCLSNIKHIELLRTLEQPKKQMNVTMLTTDNFVAGSPNCG
jgi:hypothetical protein